MAQPQIPANQQWQGGASTQPSTMSQTNNLNPDKILQDFLKLPPGLRKFYSQALKNADYSVGKVTGAPTPRLIQAYLQAQADFENYRTASGQPGLKFEDYLTTIDVSAEGGGDGQPRVRRDVTVSTPETAATLIEKIMQDLVGRGPTNDELKKYTSELIAAQKARPQVTTYSTSGDTVTSMTTPGLDEQSFLIEQISGTDEAKAQKVFSFYDVFKKAIGAS
jgi:hypothetical protein